MVIFGEAAVGAGMLAQKSFNSVKLYFFQIDILSMFPKKFRLFVLNDT